MGKAAEAGKENWLLIKHRDEQADGHDVVEDEPQSVVSGKASKKLPRAKPRAKRQAARETNNHIRARTFTEKIHTKAAPENVKTAVTLTRPERLGQAAGVRRAAISHLGRSCSEWRWLAP